MPSDRDSRLPIIKKIGISNSYVMIRCLIVFGKQTEKQENYYSYIGNMYVIKTIRKSGRYYF